MFSYEIEVPRDGKWGGPPPPRLILGKKKKSQKEEKPVGLAKQNRPPP